MKNLLKVGVALLIAAVMFGACDFETNDDDGSVDSGVDFKAYTGDNAAMFVRNETTQRLVAFKGELRNDALLGGIPAGPGGSHGFRKNLNLFPANQAVEFSMLIIREADYIEHRNRLADAPLFTRVYVLYNSQGENLKSYSISPILGGNQRINLIGHAMYNIEWRQDGIEGPTLGYAPQNMMNTNLNILPGEYLLFPVFKYFNPVHGTVNTIFPTVGTGNDRGYWFDFFVANNPSQTIQLDPTEALKVLDETKTLGAAWMVIVNNATTGVQARSGNVLYTDAMGYSAINTGSSRTIQIDMSSVNGTFASSRSVGNINIGVTGRNTTVRDENGNTTFTLQTDYQYDVVVEGNVQAGQHTAIINIGSGTKIEFN
jgi:hypothetical protein